MGQIKAVPAKLQSVTTSSATLVEARISREGYVYEGQVRDNDANGKGKYISSEGYYFGHWEHGLQNGLGKEVFNSGD
jgi:hypothetical protein